MDNTEEVVNESTRKSPAGMIIALILIVIIAVGGYMLYSKNKSGMPQPDKNVVSVATVNGVVIPQVTYDTQLASAIAIYKSQGLDTTAPDKMAQIKTQVIDSLIGNELLVQAVVSANVKADPAEVEKQYQATQTQVGGADKLKLELVKNNMTDAQFRINIAKQLALQAYLLQNIDVKSITVTDAEMSQFYADYTKAQKVAGQKTIPALKDLSVQIKQQITSNKQQQLLTALVAQLRAKAKIEITVK